MDMQVGIDANQARVEGRVVDLGHGHAVAQVRLAQRLVTVRNDVRRIDQSRLGQAGQGAAAAVGSKHTLAEHSLVQPLLDGAHGVATVLGIGWRPQGGSGLGRAESQGAAEARDVPLNDERWE